MQTACRAPISSLLFTESAINEEVHQLHDSSIQAISTFNLNFKTPQAETQSDQQLSEMIQNLQNNSVGEDTIFTLNNGIVLELIHTHLGISKMINLARRYVYWKSIDKDIKNMV